MIDTPLVIKKLAFIEECIRELRSLARLDDFDCDIREQRFVLHTLQLALQAMLDVASHIVSDHRLGEPQSNRDLFSLLARSKWIPREHLPTLQSMAGLRNILVHGYLAVDSRIVREIVEHRLDDRLVFSQSIRKRAKALDEM
jgi:uncharacterized protein YutE (UPF0331/DUF86 family)